MLQVAAKTLLCDNPFAAGLTWTRWIARGLAAGVLFGLAACTGPSLPLPPLGDQHSTLTSCERFYRHLDNAVQEAGVIDARAQRLHEAPYFRTSRFLASFDPAQLAPEAYAAWLERLNQLAIQGLALEWRRLPESGKAELRDHWPGETANLEQTLSDCGQRLSAHLAASPRREALEARDHYQTWKRWLGLYPLVAVPFYQRILQEQEVNEQKQRQHRKRLEQGDSGGDWALFTPPGERIDIASALQALGNRYRDPLGIPQLDEQTQQRLLQAFMPALAIASGPAGLEDNDRPTRLGAGPSGRIQFDPDRAGLYTHISHGRYRNQVTVQLNYSVWFPERRPEGPLDLLAGQYNGVTWRVHLHPDGAVIGYDKMHQCGCWYQFYPAMGFRSRPELPLTQEPFYIGSTLDPRQALTLWLESNTHHLLGVSHRQPEAEPRAFEVRPYHELRALADERGRYHSPFDTRGLIPESRRLERYFFWPMGIASPGAQRIHGTHAIAFIGRRHFDDPWLLRELGL